MTSTRELGFRKEIMIAIILIVMTLGFIMSPMSVFAANQGSNATIADYLGSGNASSSVTSKFTVLSAPDDATYDASYSVYQITDASGATKYYYIKSDREAEVVSSITNRQSNTTAVNDISAITNNLGVDATQGIGTATTMLSGFTGILNTILGVLIVLISLGMTVFSAFDLCFIAFPVFRNKCEDAKQGGAGAGLLTKGGKGGGETKLRFVSDDAQYAVMAADTVQSGKNPFVIYFGKRLISYIVLAILLFILMTGKITIFTELALKVVSGILDVLQGI